MSPALENVLAMVIEEAQRKARIPGLVVAVSVGGERAAVCRGTTVAGSAIPMIPAARFQIGCITKVLTCAVAMQLAHEGTIDLDAPIDEYLPNLAAPAEARGIRVRDLGTHTSGYLGLNPSNPEHGRFYSWPKFVEFFRHTPQVFRPGTVFNSEHTECVILGEVIRRVAGVPCETLVRDLILEPLQLATGTVERDAGQPEVRVADHSLDRASGEYATVRSVPYCDFWASSLSPTTASPVDLVTIGEMLCGMRHVPGICAEALDDVRRQVVEVPRASGGTEREISPYRFGFGCGEFAPGVFGRNGSARGQTLGLRFSPRQKVVVVVGINCWDVYARDSLLDSVLHMLLPELAAGHDAPQGDPELNVNDLEGTYTGCVPGVQIAVTRSGGGLACAIGGLIGGSAQKLNVEVLFDETGELRVSSPMKHLALGFFREKGTGAPAMRVGLNAFRKA